MTGRRKNVLVVDALEDTRERLATPLKRDYRIMRAVRRPRSLGRDEIVCVADVDLPSVTGSAAKIIKANYPLTEHPGDGTSTSMARSSVRSSAPITSSASRSIPIRPHGRACVSSARSQPPRAEPACGVQDRPRVRDRESTRCGLLETVQVKWPATVLILGETAPGKGCSPRMIHRDLARTAGQSPGDRPLSVNVAAIPRDLVESTLFGHEKGSFTGALQQRIGKFELANGGSLFLDEIGDLKLDLQAKLLRAIQEGEIERIGGGKPIKTTFRLIAATNIDLEKAVKEGSFRGDLYYRLNVIPLRLPPLRDRRRGSAATRRGQPGRRALPSRASQNRRSGCWVRWWPAASAAREPDQAGGDVPGLITDDDLPVDFQVMSSTPRTRAKPARSRGSEATIIQRSSAAAGTRAALPRRAAVDAQVQDGSAEIRAGASSEAGTRRVAVEIGSERRRGVTPLVRSRGCAAGERYFLGRTASFNCLTIRAFTTVFAGILIGSPVAGLRPMRALRF
jgi:hypothetical protein